MRCVYTGLDERLAKSDDGDVSVQSVRVPVGVLRVGTGALGDGIAPPYLLCGLISVGAVMGTSDDFNSAQRLVYAVSRSEHDIELDQRA